MDTTIINNGDERAVPEKEATRVQPFVSEQLQTLSLYVYLDARRYGTTQ